MASFSMHMFRVVGRLKPGVSAAQGVADLSLISRRIHNAHLNDPFVFRSANSRSLLEHMVGEIKKPLYVLLEATCCLLLIACLNVANLLVARAAARSKELAIRTALGGGWLRLIGERLMECLLLSTSGGGMWPSKTSSASAGIGNRVSFALTTSTARPRRPPASENSDSPGR